MKPFFFVIFFFQIYFPGLFARMPLTDNLNKEEVELEPGQYQLNDRYRGGPHLIYDCRGLFFACVDIESKEKCQQSREISFQKKEEILRCAPLASFKDKESCLKRNYEAIGEVQRKIFCYPPLKNE